MISIELSEPVCNHLGELYDKKCYGLTVGYHVFNINIIIFAVEVRNNSCLIESSS